MSTTRTKALTVLAPAKVNLYLHVTGRQDNGYHTLDSLVAFADIGDKIQFTPASDFSFVVQGPYEGGFTFAERDSSPNSANLVVRAAWALAQATHKDLRVRVTLTKNLPLAAGLGGGSSDAAAVLWGLMEWWDISQQTIPGLADMVMALGADVPACLSCNPVIMRGVGEVLEPAPLMEEMPILLVHPGKRCSTADIFTFFDKPFRKEISLPEDLSDPDGFVAFLAEQDNDLTDPAVKAVPVIAELLDVLGTLPGCRLARMSGSGATCFAFFNDETSLYAAAEKLVLTHPDWWVRAGTLNRPERY